MPDLIPSSKIHSLLKEWTAGKLFSSLLVLGCPPSPSHFLPRRFHWNLHCVSTWLELLFKFLKSPVITSDSKHLWLTPKETHTDGPAQFLVYALMHSIAQLFSSSFVLFATGKVKYKEKKILIRPISPEGTDNFIVLFPFKFSVKTASSQLTLVSTP